MKFLQLLRRLLRRLGIVMPTNIPGSSASYPTNVVGPSDGDTRNAASINTGLEDLADRTAYLKAKARITADGVQRVRTIQPSSDPPGGSDLEISDVENGDIVVLLGYGVFQYVTPSAVTIDDVNVFGADDGGTGRWLRVDRKLRGLAKGVASLDSDAKVPAGQLATDVAQVWGRFEINAGAYTYVAGTGFDAMTGHSNGTGVQVALDAPRPSTGYAVFVQQCGNMGVPYVFDVVILDDETFRIEAYDMTGANADLKDVVVTTIFIMVMGG